MKQLVVSTGHQAVRECQVRKKETYRIRPSPLREDHFPAVTQQAGGQTDQAVPGIGEGPVGLTEAGGLQSTGQSTREEGSVQRGERKSVSGVLMVL